MGLSVNNLAEFYRGQARYDEAERHFKRALAIREKALGPDHSDIAGSLNNLAILYFNQGRYDEAEPLYKRAIEIRENILRPNHPRLATPLNNLADLYTIKGRFDEAVPLFKRSLAILEKAFGSEHRNIAKTLNNLAGVYLKQGSYEESERLQKRALAIREKIFNSGHPDVATSLNNLAKLYWTQGLLGKTEPLYKRSLAIDEKSYGPDHPKVAHTLSNMTLLYLDQGRHDLALKSIRRASVIHRDRAARASGGRSAGYLSEQRKVRDVFFRHLRATIEIPTADPSARGALTGEGFEVSQLANATGTGAAVARMAARFAAGDDKVATRMRERQDAVERWRKLDGAMVKAASRPSAKRDKSSEAAMRQELTALDQKIIEIDGQLATAFPQLAELTASKPVPLAEAQALLAADEALLTYQMGDDGGFIFVVRSDRALVTKVDLRGEELSEAVSVLRFGLDPSQISRLADIPPYDTGQAFQLYQKIFQPVEPMLDGARHVFVVAGGALQSLPLGVLVTGESQGEFTDFSGYRAVPWLARKYAFTTLPSVSSLRALRTFAKRTKAHIPFTGFGDPLLKGHPGSNRGVKLASLYRGTIANVNAVRNLPPLPDTADELRALSATMNGDDKRIYLRKEATEKTVKNVNLSSSRVIAFATHGLLAGDMDAAEPALVLTPPENGTTLDDGLLTASEVAQLKLNAELVILSACNTAGGDGTDGAEGLSGLAKAFFYAGSRALLVSHWPVVSDAAVKLTTGMLDYQANNPAVGWAEALRRSMLALSNNEEKPHYAHPLFWAPFVVVGEGGAATVN